MIIDKPKTNGNVEKEVKRTTPPTNACSWKIDWCQIRSVLFTVTAIAVLMAIGVWVGMKLMGNGGVNIFIGSGEKELVDGDSAQGLVEEKWTQVRIEKTSGSHVTKPPDENEVSAVLEFNATNAPTIFGDDARAISFLFVSKKSLPGEKFDTALREYHAAAKELKDEKVTFTYVDIDREDAARVVDFFSVSGVELPAIRVHSIEDGKMLKFKPDSAEVGGEKLSSGQIVDFVRSHLSGALKPYYRSEPIPSDWDQKAVKVLTGDNFDQVVNDASKHVFVEFYASWCGHCKQLAPIWEQLADKYKDHKDVVIAQMDAIANEVPGLQVRAFPTIKLFPAAADGENSQGIDYNGPRTVEGFSKFIDSFVSASVPTGDEI